jgi:hypothetical protein
MHNFRCSLNKVLGRRDRPCGRSACASKGDVDAAWLIPGLPVARLVAEAAVLAAELSSQSTQPLILLAKKQQDAHSCREDGAAA